MVNVEKLRAAMEASGVSVEDAAAALGVNRATLYRRLSNPVQTSRWRKYRIWPPC